MKRTRIALAEVASHANLCRAAMLAARGKRERPEVARFFADLDGSLTRLAAGILAGQRPLGEYRRFVIRDPKPRVIHAACFEDRVLHHALFAHAGPVLERALVDSACACRIGLGPTAAVQRAQAGLRRWPWYVQVDIARYFPSVRHDLLLNQLGRLLKGDGVLALLRRIVGGFATAPGRGLPIGTLASQYFANLYLAPADRYLMETLGACGHVRYMDDSLWFCADRESARTTLAALRDFVGTRLALTLKPSPQINRSSRGVTFCGHRILPGSIRLTARRRRRARDLRRAWEAAYAHGEIDAAGLQRAVAAVLGLSARADALGWRRRDLHLHPAVDA